MKLQERLQANEQKRAQQSGAQPLTEQELKLQQQRAEAQQKLLASIMGWVMGGEPVKPEVGKPPFLLYPDSVSPAALVAGAGAAAAAAAGDVDSQASPVLVHVIPAEHCGAPVLCPLVFDEGTAAGDFPPLCFSYHHVKHYLASSTAVLKEAKVARLRNPAIRALVVAAGGGDGDVDGGSSRSARDVSVPRSTSPVPSTSSIGKSARPTFEALQYPDHLPLVEYVSQSGLQQAGDVQERRAEYGPNTFDVPPPTFKSLFIEHAMAPFFVFQIFCIALWMMDEYWYYSLFTLGMLVLFESLVVYRRLSQAKDLMGMRPPPHNVYVYRGGRWVIIVSSEIVPGDVVSLTRATTVPPIAPASSVTAAVSGVSRVVAANGDASASDAGSSALSPAGAAVAAAAAGIKADEQSEWVVPCDCLLLAGSLVVNEAMLTGESVPQLKEAVTESIEDATAEDADVPTAAAAAAAFAPAPGASARSGSQGRGRQAPAAAAAPAAATSSSSGAADGGMVPLAVEKAHKRHVVFGGTKVLMITTPTSSTSTSASTSPSGVDKIPPPPNHGVPAYALRTGFNSFQGGLVRSILLFSEPAGSDPEALAFIGCLLFFAVIAAYHVLTEGLADESRSRYKLLLHCIMILTSVVPAELPMQLSLAVNNSLMALFKHRIFCTEPFKIPRAGAVDVCCFDKV